jgi:hypothetical protein
MSSIVKFKSGSIEYSFKLPMQYEEHPEKITKLDIHLLVNRAVEDIYKKFEPEEIQWGAICEINFSSCAEDAILLPTLPYLYDNQKLEEAKQMEAAIKEFSGVMKAVYEIVLQNYQAESQ